ncbi:unnamed protein product, partial [Boreogadus saida]
MAKQCFFVTQFQPDRPPSAPTVTDVNRLFCVGLRGLNNPDIVATDVDPPPPGPTQPTCFTRKHAANQEMVVSRSPAELPHANVLPDLRHQMAPDK